MNGDLEAAAIVNYENWAGSWAAAPEGRKDQSRKEVLKIIEAFHGIKTQNQKESR